MTNKPPRHFLLSSRLLLLALVAAPCLRAQQNPQQGPHLGYVYPAGGKQGTSFTVHVGGQNLKGVTEAYFSGVGVSARVTGFDEPLTPKEQQDLREKMQELMRKRAAVFGRARPEFEPKKTAEKAGTEQKTASAAKPESSSTPSKWTPEDEKMLEHIRVQLMKRSTRAVNPALADTVTLEVTLAPDAAPGAFDLRLKTDNGLSNPMVFQVGQLPEFTESVVTSTTNPAPGARRGGPQGATPPRAERQIDLPIVVNGQILPGEVDRYRFGARKGQHITVAVNARTLIPYLADAVPGWFQATLALYDPKGHEVAYGDSFRFSPDPVVSYEIPEDGMYSMEVKDSIYRGREDFVYRIAVGELPFVTSIFPLGGHFSETAKFELNGWNLPGSAIQMDTKNKSPGMFLLSVRNRGQLSNAIRFALDSEPATLEAEPNGQPATAQAITLPAVVDGRIESPGDEDVFRLEGKAGTEIVAEVFSRRLGSPLDSILKITDAGGRQLAMNDDNEDKGAGLMTHHADSRVTLKLPADGPYFITLGDTQRNGGREYGYRLRVGPPRPDFELRVVPSVVNLKPGAHVPITVYALRRDGFDGEIILSLQDAQAGLRLAGARIPAGQDKVQLTITGSASGRQEPVKVTMVGAAVIAGTPVGHLAVPADDMMQAFAYHHLVPAREWLVYSSGRPAPMYRLLTQPPLKLPAGGTAKVEVSTMVVRGIDNASVELSDPPEGITVKKTSVSGSNLQIVIACDAAKVKPGLKGNLILNTFGERGGANKKGPRAQKTRIGTIQAIPFEIVGAPVAGK